MKTGDALGLTLEQVAGDWQLVAYLDADGLDTYQRLSGEVGMHDTPLPFEPADPMRVPVLAGDLTYLQDREAAEERAIAINKLAVASEHSKIVEAFLGTRHVSDSRLHFGVEVVRPEGVDDAFIADLAENVMQSFATRLGYLGDVKKRQRQKRIQEYVRAGYDTQRGVTLTVDVAMGLSIETTDRYDPESPTIHLNQHNIYNQQQEFILLCGAVAIARAEELSTEL